MSDLSDWVKFAPKPRELGNDDQWTVFLSYRSVNRSWVLNLYDVLRDQGHKVFLDQCVLKTGDRLETTLGVALRASQAGILIWSESTRDSKWVQDEYETMTRLSDKKKGFQFVPIKLDNSELPGLGENRIFLDFSAYPDGPSGGELLRLLHAVVGIPLTEEAAHFANLQDDVAKKSAAKIGAAIRAKNPERIIQLFAEGDLQWQTSAALGCKAAEGLTKLARYEEAIQMLEVLEQRFPNSIRPKQLHALALARRGGENDLPKAQELLGELIELGEKDPETLGIYARTWMDRYQKSGDIEDLKNSRHYYAEAFSNAQDDYYTGINAAAKSVFLGDDKSLKDAAEYARKVEEIVRSKPYAGDYWMSATLAEVFLIQKKYKEAAEQYEAAIGVARTEIGSHESTWQQASRLMEKLQPSAEERALIQKPFAHLSV